MRAQKSAYTYYENEISSLFCWRKKTTEHKKIWKLLTILVYFSFHIALGIPTTFNWNLLKMIGFTKIITLKRQFNMLLQRSHAYTKKKSLVPYAQWFTCSLITNTNVIYYIGAFKTRAVNATKQNYRKQQ